MVQTMVRDKCSRTIEKDGDVCIKNCRGGGEKCVYVAGDESEVESVCLGITLPVPPSSHSQYSIGEFTHCMHPPPPPPIHTGLIVQPLCEPCYNEVSKDTGQDSIRCPHHLCRFPRQLHRSHGKTLMNLFASSALIVLSDSHFENIYKMFL